MDLWQGILILLSISFVVLLIVSSVYVSKASNVSGENSTETASAIRVITIMNGIMTAVLGIAAFIYMSQNPAFERPYTQFIAHLGLLFGIIAISITSIQQVNIGATSQPTMTVGSNCPK